MASTTAAASALSWARSRATWRALLRSTPQEVVERRSGLTSRAQGLAAACTCANLPPELDVVIAGSGFMGLYYLGVQSLLTALEETGRVRLRRYAGASSGAQLPFQILLTDLPSTIDCYLSYGVLCEREPTSLVRAVPKTDAEWVDTAEWLFAEHAARCASSAAGAQRRAAAERTAPRAEIDCDFPCGTGWASWTGACTSP